MLRLQTRVLLAALLTSLLTAGVLGLARRLELDWPAAVAAAALMALVPHRSPQRWQRLRPGRRCVPCTTA